jgi:hypothetical protein
MRRKNLAAAGGPWCIRAQDSRLESPGYETPVNPVREADTGTDTRQEEIMLTENLRILSTRTAVHIVTCEGYYMQKRLPARARNLE